MNEQSEVIVPPAKGSTAKPRSVYPRVCARCIHHSYDGQGAWGCALGVAGGDVGDKDDWMTTCRRFTDEERSNTEVSQRLPAK
jgi:hypothetical protein